MPERSERPHHNRVLIADDQPDVVEALRLLLVDEGYRVEAAASPAEALARLESEDFDLALVDLNYTRDTTSGQEGLDLLERIRAMDPALPVVIMTAWSSVPIAVEAMRRGARDYLEKPWDDDRLIACVRTQIELRRAMRRSERAEEAAGRLQRTPVFIAESPSMKDIARTIDRVASSDAAVLITGEHGTGKEVVAAWLHARSDRRTRPMVTMNAGGLADGVAESELFGHVKGAFTDARADRLGCFELADEGTLFLDEIANMPVRLQAKLLRVLQTGEVQRVGSSKMRYVNVRILSATNASLDAELAAGRFREDLLYRLNTVVLHLPPLRERPEDVAPLAAHFLVRYAARYGKRVASFEPAALSTLGAHRWPGNVRELAHSVERAVLMAEPGAETLGASDLLLGPGFSRTSAQDVASGFSRTNLDELPLEQIEHIFIQKALARHAGDVRRAAAQLGLSRSALYRRLQQMAGASDSMGPTDNDDSG
ncbi:MAG: sigma-54-dependent transcriptional regulator [Vicinamibacterales bacterium]